MYPGGSDEVSACAALPGSYGMAYIAVFRCSTAERDAGGLPQRALNDVVLVLCLVIAALCMLSSGADRREVHGSRVGRSGKDGGTVSHCVPTPRKIVKHAGNSFVFALVAYMASIAIKLADTTGVAFGIGMGAILLGSIAAALLVLQLSGSLDLD